MNLSIKISRSRYWIPSGFLPDPPTKSSLSSQKYFEEGGKKTHHKTNKNHNYSIPQFPFTSFPPSPHDWFKALASTKCEQSAESLATIDRDGKEKVKKKALPIPDHQPTPLSPKEFPISLRNVKEQCVHWGSILERRKKRQRRSGWLTIHLWRPFFAHDWVRGHRFSLALFLTSTATSEVRPMLNIQIPFVPCGVIRS